MEPGSPPSKFGWMESDVEILNYSSPTDANPFSSPRGPQLVKARSPPQLPAVLGKIHPETVTNRSDSQANQDAHRPLCARSSLLYLQAILATVVLICLLCTIWLIFLNISPNYTVNLVVNTEDFDDGSFWLWTLLLLRCIWQ
ncbi:hypothetical protein PF005_g33196 [Phytophthora fragariae]|uniref:Uncharacterized protein n=1 Tax=Phytophthora fragariae TaxID=53985 RepID=A0A6A3V0F8_9STRA|nr:hypothetical protein PF003_g30185 [Phytophthora fragariae]KAE9156475.1 hypothetical protein PF005_g33196 [Phytophthora fragariae]